MPNFSPPSLRARLEGRVIAPARRELTRRVDGLLVEPTKRAALGLAIRIDSIVSALTGLGGMNDKGTSSRPVANTPLTRPEIETLYRENGYVRRYVDTWADEQVHKGWTLIEDRRRVGDLEDDEERLHAHEHMVEALRTAALFGGSLIVMVTNDVAGSPEALKTPLNLEAVSEVLALVPLEEGEFSVDEYDGDFAGGTFREPLIYRVHPTTATAVSGALRSGEQVHASRCLYFFGAKLTTAARYANGGIDGSLIEAMWPQIRNLETFEQSCAIMAVEAKQDVMKVEGLAALTTSDQAELLAMRMQAIATQRSSANMVIVGDGEQFESRAGTLTGIGELRGVFESGLSAVSSMPRTILFGDSPGGLSTDDAASRRAWDRYLSLQQKKRLKRPVNRLVDVLSAAAGNAERTSAVAFNPLGEVDERTKAEVRKLQIETYVLLIREGVIAPEDVTTSLFSEDGWRDELLPVDVEAQPSDVELEEPEAEPVDPDAEPVDPDAEQGVDPAAVNPADVQKAAFNGAQIAAVVDIVTRVGLGDLPKSSARALLLEVMPLTPEAVDAILAEIVEGSAEPEPVIEVPEPEPEPVIEVPEIDE